jgi:hypothetical protein
VPCAQTGVELRMPQVLFRPGDECWLRATVCNASPQTLAGIPLFVILDLYGGYWCYPGWQPLDQGLDYSLRTFPAGTTGIEVIAPFPWPSGSGAASGIRFYSALTDPGITYVVGTIGVWEFAWSEG